MKIFKLKQASGFDSSVLRAEAAIQRDTGIVGWNLYHTCGCNWLTSERCAETPQAGEQAVFEGRGFGFPVTGIVIGGRRYR
jgi:hypothetical protein